MHPRPAALVVVAITTTIVVALFAAAVATATASAAPQPPIRNTASFLRRASRRPLSSLAAAFSSTPCHISSSSRRRRVAAPPAFIPPLARQQQPRLQQRFSSTAAAATSVYTMTAAHGASSEANGSSSSNGGGVGGGSAPPLVIRAKVLTDTKEAGRLLRAGQLVAFPTETVYGLGASAYDEAAVRRIFEVKGRPLTDPLIAHVAQPAQAWAVFQCGGSGDESDGSSSSQGKERKLLSVLAERFWPGPLTLVAPAAAAIPGAVTAETGWVGVRCPAHPVARSLLQEAGLPVVAPSANRFGHVSPTSAQHVIADLGAHDIAVLDVSDAAASTSGAAATTTTTSSSTSTSSNGDNTNGCRIGIESTVAKVDAAAGTITILRAGAVTASQIQACLAANGVTGVDVRVLQRRVSKPGGGKEGESVLEEAEGPQVSPGQSITHYAPDRPTFLLAPQDAGAEWVEGVAGRAVVLDFGGRLKGVEPLAAHYRDLSLQGNLREAAAGLFECLRWAEGVGEGGLRVLVVDLREEEQALPSQDEREFAAALIDRILRAASGREAGAYLLNNKDS